MYCYIYHTRVKRMFADNNTFMCIYIYSIVITKYPDGCSAVVYNKTV